MRTLHFPVLCLALGLIGCSFPRMTSGVVPTKFISSSGASSSSKIARLPFIHAWRAPSADISQYKHIVIRPVTTAYLPRDENSKKSKKLARYFSAALRREFSSPVCSFYLTDSPTKPGTLILEVALTQVSLTGLENVAFEARVRNADTGKTVATVADRRETQTRSAAEICDEWSRQLMEATNKELFPIVNRAASSPF